MEYHDNATLRNYSASSINVSGWRVDGSPSGGGFDHCYSLYLYGRILVPSLHALVTIVGLFVNLYMMRALFRGNHYLFSIDSLDRTRSARGVVVSHFDYFFIHIGLCDIVMLTTIPLWITQTVFNQGWVFGYAACKIIKGLITFSLQYGIIIMVYINVQRFLKVAYNKTIPSCFEGRVSKRRMVSLLCACVPLFSSIVDIYFYTEVEVGGNVAKCLNIASPEVKLAGLWIRTSICFIIPIVVLVFCNGLMMYVVRRHVRKVSSAGIISRSLKGAQIIPLLTVVVFLVCWIPWIVSNVYYSFSQARVRCPFTMFMVINLSLVMANMHCVMTPLMYLFMRYKKGGNTVRRKESLSSPRESPRLRLCF